MFGVLTCLSLNDMGPHSSVRKLSFICSSIKHFRNEATKLITSNSSNMLSQVWIAPRSFKTKSKNYDNHKYSNALFRPLLRLRFVCLLCIPLHVPIRDLFLISFPRRLPIWTRPSYAVSSTPFSPRLAFVTEHYSPIWGMIISWLASEVLFPEAPLCAKSSHSFDMWTSSSWWNAIVMNKWGIASAVGPWTKRTLPSWHANAESCSLPVLPVGPSWKCEEMHIQTGAFWGS